MQQPETIEKDDQDQSRHLIFRLGRDMVAVALEEVREVIKKGDVKPVPFMQPFVSGVINRRGQILTVVELASMLGHHQKDEASQLLLLVEKGQEKVAVAVEDVVEVTSIPKDAISFHPQVATWLPPQAIQGFARTQEQWVTLISLQQLVEPEQFALKKEG